SQGSVLRCCASPCAHVQWRRAASVHLFPVLRLWSAQYVVASQLVQAVRAIRMEKSAVQSVEPPGRQQLQASKPNDVPGAAVLRLEVQRRGLPALGYPQDRLTAVGAGSVDPSECSPRVLLLFVTLKRHGMDTNSRV